MYRDKTVVCKDCGEEFVFTVGEQEFYAEKGFANEPSRCKGCRSARKAGGDNGRRGGGGGGGVKREMHPAVCAECGAPTKVPFMPKNDRPIYCSECFQARR